MGIVSTYRRAFNTKRLDPYPVETLNRVERPTTKINENQIKRPDEREHGFAKARRGDFGPHIKKQLARFIGKYPLSGAMSLRAILPNPERTLLPGMFVKLQLTTGAIENAFVLPQAALLRDDQGAYVFVVGPDGKVAKRRLEIQGMTRSDWIVTGNLADGDQVIEEGLQKVQPGALAKAVPARTSASDNSPKP